MLELSNQFESSVLEDGSEMRVGPGHGAVFLVLFDFSAARDILLDDQNPVRLQADAAALEKLFEVKIGQMTKHPLAPNHVVKVFLWSEVLEAWKLITISYFKKCIIIIVLCCYLSNRDHPDVWSHSDSLELDLESLGFAPPNPP